MLPFVVDENSAVIDEVSTHSCPHLGSKPLPARPDPLGSATSHQRSKSAASEGKGGRGLARHRRNSWMRSSIVRRAAVVVDDEVAALCEKSPFLSSAHGAETPDVAHFHRIEITLGKGLGRGGFAEVYAVAGLKMDDEWHDDHDEQANLRRQFQKNLQSPDGRPVYAIKFLKKKLLKSTRDFQHAAIDMAVEARYLAALNHPNIIKIRGLTMGGTTAFRTGGHDCFFLIMDYLPETLEHRIQRWKKCGEKNHRLSLHYARQIASALAYLHYKAIVYRDLKPQNLGFKEEDVIQLFDFGLCRELPKPKGQSHHDENLEDEETFHMSGVGTQRYMSPEIITTRRYNLKTDVYSWSMVFLEMMTLNKPFEEYDPEEHASNVAKLGERPRLRGVEEASEETDSKAREKCQMETEGDDSVPQDNDESGASSKPKKKGARIVSTYGWPAGVPSLLEQSWSQDVTERLTMETVLRRMDSIITNNTQNDLRQSPVQGKGLGCGAVRTDKHQKDKEIILEFPSHFSPKHEFSMGKYDDRMEPLQYEKQFTPTTTEDSDWVPADRQSETSTSYQELTMTSVSTTLHDSDSTAN